MLLMPALVISSNCGPFGSYGLMRKVAALGLLQYIAPTLQLTLGVWLFDEPFVGARLVGFAIIWVALGLFAVESVVKARRGAV